MSGFYESIKEQSVALYETIVEGISDFKVFVSEAWPLLILLLVILFTALWISDPVPPDKVVMAVGPKNSANDILANKYKHYFKSKGVDLELVNTEGSLENLKLLEDKSSPVKAAFVMTGSADNNDKNIYTLGSVDYEPLWCFYRGETDFLNNQIGAIKMMMAKKINIGQEGSGTYHLVSQILGLLKTSPESNNFTKFSTDEAIAKLGSGELDAMCFADSADNPNVEKLAGMENVHLADMVKAEALSRKVPAIEMVIIPQGALDLVNDIPKHNVNMVSSTNEILVDKSLHPALQTLFLMAAKKINGGEGFFSKEGEFPSFKDNFVKRSPEAETFYAKGEPYMVAWLPFWLSEFARRLVLTLLPLAAIAYPVIRSTPNYYKNRVKGRINKLYGEIKFFEQQLLISFDKDKKDEYLMKLNEIEGVALKMKVPKSLSQDYFTMRSSIDFIVNRIDIGFYDKPNPELQNNGSVPAENKEPIEETSIQTTQKLE